jgi:hypothetical protein
LVADDKNAFVGQVAEEPVQFSATSQVPAEDLQTVEDGLGVQIPTDPEILQASQSPPQAVLQQYPSIQLPEQHSPPTEQDVPLEEQQLPVALFIAPVETLPAASYAQTR